MKRPQERRAGRRGYGERSTGGSRRCIMSLVAFLVILGVAFGLVFGLIPIDEIKRLLGMSGGDEEDGGNASPTASPTEEERYEFMQCKSGGICCNGLTTNCNLRPNEILWPVVHNAMHDGLLGNNNAPLEKALEAGYRGLLLDVCSCKKNDGTDENELVLCHGVCALGVRKFDEVFPNINQFLDNNPTESILINFEISVGDPKPTTEEIWDAMSQYQGIKEKTYVHNGGAFPTMKNLLQDNKQLLLFKHNGVDCSVNSVPGCSNKIMEFHKYAIETNYEFRSEAEIENYSESCKGTRGTSGTGDFYAINHFVTRWTGASEEAAETINEKASLEARITQCKSITGIDANMVSVDFWQQGDLLEVVQEINKVRGQSRRSLRSRFVDWVQH